MIWKLYKNNISLKGLQTLSWSLEDTDFEPLLVALHHHRKMLYCSREGIMLNLLFCICRIRFFTTSVICVPACMFSMCVKMSSRHGRWSHEMKYNMLSRTRRQKNKSMTLSRNSLRGHVACSPFTLFLKTTKAQCYDICKKHIHTTHSMHTFTETNIL